jgi:hypothetical protein
MARDQVQKESYNISSEFIFLFFWIKNKKVKISTFSPDCFASSLRSCEVEILISRGSAYKIATDSGTMLAKSLIFLLQKIIIECRWYELQIALLTYVYPHCLCAFFLQTPSSRLITLMKNNIRMQKLRSICRIFNLDSRTF